MKLKDILCGEYDNPKVFSSEFYKKHGSKKRCIFRVVETEKLNQLFLDIASVPCGNGPDAPTKEKYVKICVEGRTAEETEGALLFLLEEYKRMSLRMGRRYLYWRREPYLFRQGRKWFGRTRLLYSNKKVLKGKT